MLRKETQVEVQVLYRQGSSIRANRAGDEPLPEHGAVRASWRARRPVRPGRSAPANFDPYKAQLQARIDGAGKVRLPCCCARSRHKDTTTASASSRSVCARFDRPCRPSRSCDSKRSRENSLQVDFVVFRRGSPPLRAFTAELGYSRLRVRCVRCVAIVPRPSRRHSSSMRSNSIMLRSPWRRGHTARGRCCIDGAPRRRRGAR
jgi:hypothetical protein